MPESTLLEPPAARAGHAWVRTPSAVQLRPERTRSVLVARRAWPRVPAVSVDLRPRGTVPLVALRRERPLLHAASPELLVRGVRRRRLPGALPAHRNAVVLVPAHNEQDNIAATIESLLAQTRRPELVVIVADNCTDRTVEIARSYDVSVFETRGNTHKKAGALNQALDRYLDVLDPRDVVLVMDADTALAPDFLENAVSYVDQGYAAVGGTFTGRGGGGFVGMLQRNEYARYARDVSRRRGKALVLTGTATVLQVEALRDVVAARAEGTLPGAPQVYDTHVLTEDNELTLALLHRGWPIIAPAGCAMTTEVMTTWGDLYRQRLRWKRGALENLVDYGLTRVTVRYWARQLWTLIGVLVTAAYLASLVLSAVAYGSITLHPVWLAVTALFSLERVVTVRSRGLGQMLLSGVLLVEMPYDIYLQGVHGKALFDAATRREGKW